MLTKPCHEDEVKSTGGSLHVAGVITLFMMLFCLLWLTGCTADEDSNAPESKAELQKTSEMGPGYERLLPTDKQQAEWPTLMPELAVGQIELNYFFAYPCPHCFQFEPQLQRWLTSDTAHPVSLRLTPVGLVPAWVDHARLYYAAKTLGFSAELHEPLFSAIHEDKSPLKGTLALAEFASAYMPSVEGASDNGLTRLQKVMDSDAVAQQILADNRLIKAFGLVSTPTLVLRQRSEDGYRYFRIQSSIAAKHGGIIASLERLLKDL